MGSMRRVGELLHPQTAQVSQVQVQALSRLDKERDCGEGQGAQGLAQSIYRRRTRNARYYACKTLLLAHIRWDVT